MACQCIILMTTRCSSLHLQTCIGISELTSHLHLFASHVGLNHSRNIDQATLIRLTALTSAPCEMVAMALLGELPAAMWTRRGGVGEQSCENKTRLNASRRRPEKCHRQTTDELTY